MRPLVRSASGHYVTRRDARDARKSEKASLRVSGPDCYTLTRSAPDWICGIPYFRRLSFDYRLRERNLHLAHTFLAARPTYGIKRSRGRNRQVAE